jgi:hypothetical protein
MDGLEAVIPHMKLVKAFNKKPTVMVGNLMMAIWTKDFLKRHSLTGAKPRNQMGGVKPALPKNITELIKGTCDRCR